MRRLYRGALVRVLLLSVAVLAAGCASLPPFSRPVAPQPSNAFPAPTVDSVFVQRERPVEPASGVASSGTLNISQVLRELLVIPAPVATSRPVQKIVDEPVFDDELNANWTMARSIGMRTSFEDSQPVFSGSRAVSVTPLKDFATLFFTVRKDSEEVYSLDRVAGVSVWINSGEQPLDPNNLSITVVGSNDYTYWVRDDKSVRTDETHFFSESRLYYLGIKNIVPPDTWVEAVVWLDKLPYEPDYKYVTGIYIKNDEWFRRTFYVDQIHLLVVE